MPPSVMKSYKWVIIHHVFLNAATCKRETTAAGDVGEEVLLSKKS